MKKALPELELKRQLSKYKSEAKIYQGIKGVETAFYETIEQLNEKDELLILGIPKQSKQMNRFFVKFGNERAKRKISARKIINLDAKEQNQTAGKLEESKYISQITPATICIAKNRVIILPQTTNELITFVIENEEITNSFRVQFETIWNQKVQTYEGIEEIRKLFFEMMEYGNYDVFAQGQKVMETLGVDFFVKWQNEKRKKGIKSRGIIGSKYKNTKEIENASTKFKYIPGFENPGAQFIFKDKIINIMLTKDPTAILIENEEIANANRTYFDLLWNQKLQTYQGKEGIKELIKEILEWGDYCGFAEGMKIVNTLGEEYFNWWQKEKEKRKIKSKLIMGSKYKNSTTVTNAYSEFKFIPNHEAPGVEMIFEDKVVNITLEEDPVAFVIRDQKVAETNKKYFEQIWNQKTQIFQGKEGIKEAIKEILDFGDYVALGEGSKLYNTLGKEFFDWWQKEKKKREIKTKIIMSNEYRNMPTVTDTHAEFKFIESFENPSTTLTFKDKIVNIVLQGEPQAIITHNKELATTNKKYFEQIWNQKANNIEGFENVTRKFDEMLESLEEDEEYLVLGASLELGDAKMRKWLDKFHKKRINEKKRVKFLATSEAYKNIRDRINSSGDQEQKITKIKKLPKEFDTPFQINLYKGNQVLLTI